MYLGLKGRNSPPHVIICKTYVVVTPLSIEALPEAEPACVVIINPSASVVYALSGWTAGNTPVAFADQ